MANGDDEEPNASDEEDIPKKKRKPKQEKKSRKRASSTIKVRTPKKPKLKKTLSQKEREKKEKEDLKKAIKANPNLRLKKRDDIELLKKDITFESRKELPVDGSPHLKNQLILRAVMLEDNNLLQKLLKDEKGYTTAVPQRSINNHDDPLCYAMKKGNLKLFSILGKECKKEWNNKVIRAAPPKCLIPTQSTGRYNSLALGGTPFIRELSISRGSKEGNQALIKVHSVKFF